MLALTHVQIQDITIGCVYFIYRYHGRTQLHTFCSLDRLVERTTDSVVGGISLRSIGEKERSWFIVGGDVEKGGANRRHSDATWLLVREGPCSRARRARTRTDFPPADRQMSPWLPLNRQDRRDNWPHKKKETEKESVYCKKKKKHNRISKSSVKMNWNEIQYYL